MSAEIRPTPGEFFDYCALPYTPRASVEGKLRSHHILEEVLRLYQAAPRALAAMRALRDHLGPHRTVWALKRQGTRAFLELYFYHYDRREQALRPSRVLQALSPYYPADPRLGRVDGLRYLLYSLHLDLTAAGTPPLPGLHVYLKGFSGRQTGTSYFVDGTGECLENLYAFYDARTERAQLEEKMIETPFLTRTPFPWGEILRPELADCRRICSASKPRSESIYYSGIGLDQFRWFLDHFDYPRELRDWVADNQARLDHLEYDVGYDYLERDGRLDTSKNGFGGTY